MSRKARDWAKRARGLAPAERLVLWYLAERADDDGLAFPSIGDIADKCEIGATSVRRHLKALADKLLLIVEARARDNGGASANLYRLAVPGAPPCQVGTPLHSGILPPAKLEGAPLPLVAGESEPSEGKKEEYPPVPNDGNASASTLADDLAGELVGFAGIPHTSRHGGEVARQQVLGWLRLGADADMLRRVIAEQSSSAQGPTAALSRFDSSVKAAIRAGTGGLAGIDRVAALAPDNQRAVIRLFRAGRLDWTPERWELYGAPPGQPGCKLDPRLLSEAA